MNKQTVKTSTWQGRQDKTRQDRIAKEQRPRYQEWASRLDWMTKHKPVHSGDYAPNRKKKI